VERGLVLVGSVIHPLPISFFFKVHPATVSWLLARAPIHESSDTPNSVQSFTPLNVQSDKNSLAESALS
jgi:hypothetical protein